MAETSKTGKRNVYQDMSYNSQSREVSEVVSTPTRPVPPPDKGVSRRAWILGLVLTLSVLGAACIMIALLHAQQSRLQESIKDLVDQVHMKEAELTSNYEAALQRTQTQITLLQNLSTEVEYLQTQQAAQEASIHNMSSQAATSQELESQEIRLQNLSAQVALLQDVTNQLVTQWDLINQSACPIGILYPANGHCYVAVNTRMTWDQAVAYCSATCLTPRCRSVGHLVDLSDSGEESMVDSLIEGNLSGSTQVWIAARRPPGGGRYEFYWNATGEALTYSNWHSGQPYRGREGHDCTKKIRDWNHEWNDGHCTDNLEFVCEFVP